MAENRISCPFWEGGKICQVCKDADAVYPDILLCESCYESSLAGQKIKEMALRSLRAKGSVRAVSGGLPSLGKRRSARPIPSPLLNSLLENRVQSAHSQGCKRESV